MPTSIRSFDPYPAKGYFSDREVRLSRPCVQLHCFLPDRDGFGSVSININTLYLYRVLFTLDGNSILQSLLGGWGIDPVLRQRGFVVGPRVDQRDEWLVRLADATVFLTAEELYQLWEVVDMLAPRFLQALVEREIAEGTLAFAIDGPRNVRLVKIRRRLWEEILRFARERDYQNGLSPWHIFDASGDSRIKTCVGSQALLSSIAFANQSASKSLHVTSARLSGLTPQFSIRSEIGARSR